MIRLSILPASLVAGLAVVQPGAAKDCRSIAPPPGVRVPERAGCKPPPTTARDKRPETKASRTPGFFDLGNGTQLRIGSSVDVEMRSRR
jgi:hypothetical protein